MSAPAAFHAELRSHNRHAVGVAVLALLASIVAWNLAYFFFNFTLLGFLSAIHGDFGPETPAWIPRTALALAAALLVWGVVDAFRRRFATASDRQVIGWHLIPDILLLPVRLTFAVGGNFSAVRRLTREEADRAWDLLVAIHQAGRAKAGTLRVIEPDPAKLHRLLGTLQMLNYVDLHPGDDDWFYTVCSPRETELRALTGGDHAESFG